MLEWEWKNSEKQHEIGSIYKKTFRAKQILHEKYVEMIHFIAAYELALCWEYNLEEEHMEKGLFIRLLQYTLKKDKKTVR